jgi:hypothetical protein
LWTKKDEKGRKSVEDTTLLRRICRAFGWEGHDSHAKRLTRGGVFFVEPLLEHIALEGIEADARSFEAQERFGLVDRRCEASLQDERCGDGR